MFDVKQFKERLRKAREDKGIKQEDFAKLIGIARASASYYENVKNSALPNVEILYKMSITLEVSIDYLMGFSEDVKTPDIEIRKICEKTGLSEEAIKSLLIIKKIDEKPLKRIIPKRELSFLVKPQKILNEIMDYKIFPMLILKIASLYNEYELLEEKHKDGLFREKQINEEKEYFDFELYKVREKVINDILSAIKLLYEKNKKKNNTKVKEEKEEDIPIVLNKKKSVLLDEDEIMLTEEELVKYGLLNLLDKKKEREREQERGAVNNGNDTKEE